MDRTTLTALLRDLTWSAAVVVPALLLGALPPTLWDEVTGLPGHPLVVHAAVVVIPVAAALLVAAAARPALRGRLRFVLPPLLGVAAVAAVLAKRTGDSLSAAVGLPAAHAEWGNNLVPLTIGLAVAGTLLLRLTESQDGRTGRAGAAGGTVRRAIAGLAGLVTVAAVAAGVMTVVVGHSGAEAAWTGTLEEARRPPATAATAPAVITLADVAQRGTSDACWTVVDGVVYDMTGFIARHPAGSDAILEMCGRDATEDYRDEHEGQPEPAEWLAVFRIGDLATG